MKKSLLGVAAVCATMALASCADKEMCYEIKTTVKVAGVESTTTTYERTTKNDIKDFEEKAKAAAELIPGVDKESIVIKSRSVPDSNCD